MSDKEQRKREKKKAYEKEQADAYQKLNMTEVSDVSKMYISPWTTDYSKVSIRWTCKRTGNEYRFYEAEHSYVFYCLNKFSSVCELNYVFLSADDGGLKLSTKSYFLVPDRFEPKSEPIVMNIL